VTEFEQGLRRTVAVYEAGIRGSEVPTDKTMRDCDRRHIYSLGYCDAAADFDTIEDVTPEMVRYLVTYTDPKATADRACRLAAKAHK
jgi:hypothetical protein